MYAPWSAICSREELQSEKGPSTSEALWSSIYLII
jgi:hypothetical protein